MPHWSEPEDPELDVDIEDGEPESLWSGPLGMGIRFGLFAVAIFGLYLGARATSGPAEIAPAPDRITVATKRPTSFEPASTASLPPAARPVASRPVQGPDLPRRMTLAPETFCDLIKVDERSNKWRRSPVYPDEWECMSNLAVSAPSKKAGTSMPSAGYDLFTMARGVGKTNVRHVRFKLSAPDQAGLDKASAIVLDRLEDLFGALNWPLPEHVSLAIRLQQPISLREQGTTFQFVKERISASSYNLIITFPKPEKAARPKDEAGKTQGPSSTAPVAAPKT